MHSRALLSCLGTAALLLSACADNPTAPVPLRPDARILAEIGAGCGDDGLEDDRLEVDEPCEEPTGGGWRFFGLPDGGVYQAAGDPSPSAPGIWLGDAVTPERCFAERNRAVVDRDADWLDDSCELELARAFAPRLHFQGDDPCPGGQPYWAAKYFPATGHVRMGYMPAYWEDCGYWFSHKGDSEFITVDVRFNASSRHWEFDLMWLSAHYGTGWTDRSQWSTAAQTQFRYRPLTHPTVLVARGKHANYRDLASCSRGFSSGDPAYSMEDECNDGGWPETEQVRFPIVPHRNVGSRHVDLVGFVLRDGAAAGSRAEGFYQNRVFGGWIREDGAKPYRELLMSDKFEARAGSWGPGPAKPDLSLAAWISGSGAVPAYSTNVWYASSKNGVAPVSYTWYVNGGYWQEGGTLVLSVGPLGESYSIGLVARDAIGQTAFAELHVYVTGSDGALWEEPY